MLKYEDFQSLSLNLKLVTITVMNKQTPNTEKSILIIKQVQYW